MSKQQEALQLLDDLDSFATPPPPATKSSLTSAAKKGTAPANDKDAAEALAFLDEMTKKSAEPRRSTSSMHTAAPVTRVTLGGINRPSTPGAPPRKSVESARSSPKPTEVAPSVSTSVPPTTAHAGPTGSWGWGSVWTSASAAIQQAKTVVDEQVKNLPQADQAKKWSEGMMDYVKNAQLDKLGQDLRTASLSTLNGLINAVAPPIAEHEVIQVTLSHDMEGYDGIESIVYRALAKILEQVEGGDLVVNQGKESRPKDAADGGRELNAVDGLEAAMKLAEANISELLKSPAEPPKQIAQSLQNPTTYSQIYLRIQPFVTTLPSTTPDSEEDEKELLQFVLYLADPSHELKQTSVTQAVPASWIDLWDADVKGGLVSGKGKQNGEWIEDMLVEVLRVGVEVVGQEYVVARMGWDRVLDEEEEEEEEEEEAKP